MTSATAAAPVKSSNADKVSLKEYVAYFCYGFGQCFS